MFALAALVASALLGAALYSSNQELAQFKIPSQQDKVVLVTGGNSGIKYLHILCL
jgi:hypothetical protein